MNVEAQRGLGKDKRKTRPGLYATRDLMFGVEESRFAVCEGFVQVPVQIDTKSQ
jgi:hypothetical protein